MTYAYWKSLPKSDWRTEPISPICETALEYGKSPSGITFIARKCNVATVKAYPAMGRGWMALCSFHARKHPEAFDAYELIKNGETWA